MRIGESLKLIDKGWIVKPEGFRVHFQKKDETEIVTKYCPGLDDSILDSDVVAWRLAWKMAQTAGSHPPDRNAGDLINIYVIDDKGNQVKYYATNQVKVFNAFDV
jgi:hypothetical protein